MSDSPERPKPATRLDYDPGVGSPANTRRLRLLTWLTVLNTLMIGGLLVAPHATPFVQRKWQQFQAAREMERERLRIVAFEQKCLAHAEPPGKVVYEEDPAEAAKLLRAAGGAYAPVLQGYDSGPTPRKPLFRPDQFNLLPGYQPPVRAAVPEYLNDFLAYTGGFQLGGFTGNFRFAGGGGGGLFGGSPRIGDAALLYLHERTTPGGEKWLVEVWLEPGFEVGSNHHVTDEGTFEVYGMVKRRRLFARVSAVPPAPAQPQFMHSKTVLLTVPDAEIPELARVKVAEPGGAGEAGDDAGADAGTDADAEGGAATMPAPRINYGNTFRVFAGQSDPAAPSRFSIDFELDGKRGTIEGRVGDGGIVLRPKEGAAARPRVKRGAGARGEPADEVWDFTAATPASRPAGAAPGG